MCGIVCAFDIKSNSDEVRSNVLKMAKKVRHRGPDWSGIYSNNNAVLAHERLAIVDPTSGKQPIISVAETTLKLRLDEVKSKNLRDQVIKNSPKENEDYFVVPKVIE